MTNLYTTKQAAEKLALHEGHIRRLANDLSIGQKLSHRVRVFTEDDIRQLAQRNQQPGRPRKQEGTA